MKQGLNVCAEFSSLCQNLIAVSELYIMLRNWIKVCSLAQLVLDQIVSMIQ